MTSHIPAQDISPCPSCQIIQTDTQTHTSAYQQASSKLHDVIPREVNGPPREPGVLPCQSGQIKHCCLCQSISRGGLWCRVHIVGSEDRARGGPLLEPPSSGGMSRRRIARGAVARMRRDMPCATSRHGDREGRRDGRASLSV